MIQVMVEVTSHSVTMVIRNSCRHNLWTRMMASTFSCKSVCIIQLDCPCYIITSIALLCSCFAVHCF